MQMIQVPKPMVYIIWQAICGLFLDITDRRVVYALQEYHGLYQGNLSIHDYFSRLKHLSDLLRDVGHLMSDPAMVINALRGLNSKFSHAISVLITHKPLPSFLFVRDYLLQEESRQCHTTKMEVASALVVGTTSTPSARPPLPPQAPALPATYSSSKNSVKNNNNKKRKAKDNKKIHSLATGTSAPSPPWSTSFNPWTGVVQVLPLLIWRPSAPGLLGPRPGNVQQPTFTASSFQPYVNNQQQGHAGLMAALHAVPPPTQYTGGGDWIMDIGASSHMANHPGILCSSSPPPLNTSIIVGNGAPLPVHSIGPSMIPTSGSPLNLCNVLISPHLIKNIISVCALTRDNFVSATFDPFGFSIKDLRTGTIMLRCNSSDELYPLHTSTNKGLTGHSFLANCNTNLWHARLWHPRHSQLHRVLAHFDFSCSKSDNTCTACHLGKHMRLPF
jgi:hypothetical protein